MNTAGVTLTPFALPWVASCDVQAIIELEPSSGPVTGGTTVMVAFSSQGATSDVAFHCGFDGILTIGTRGNPNPPLLHAERVHRIVTALYSRSTPRGQ